MEKKKDDGDKVALKREINLIEGIAIISGLIIGSGIYVAPTGVMKQVESPGLALILWILAGVVETIGAIVFAEIGTTIPVAGEKYAYLKEMFGPFPAFLQLWQYGFMTRPSANTVKCLMFALYILQPFFPNCSVPRVAVVFIAICVACLFTFINAVNVQGSTKVQTTATIFSIAALSTISITGIIYITKGHTEFFDEPFSMTSDQNINGGGVFIGFYLVLFAYSGWFALNFLIEEMKNPYRDLPIAIVISMIIVTTLYVLVNVAYLAVLGPGVMSQSDAVAVTFADRTLGSLSWVIAVLIAINSCASLNSGIMIGSRLCFAGARGKELPLVMSFISVKYCTPITALLFQLMLMIVMCVTIDIYSLLANIVFVNTFFNALATYGMLYLRWKQPKRHRPLKLPIIIPIFYAIVMTVLIVVPVVLEPRATAMGLIIVLSTGVPYYLLFVVEIVNMKFLEKPSKQFAVLTQRFLYAAPPDTTT